MTALAAWCSTSEVIFDKDSRKYDIFQLDPNDPEIHRPIFYISDSECSDLSEFDENDVIDEFEDDEKSLEEIQGEVDHDFEKLFKELDDLDKEIEGMKQVLG
uniref:Site-specific DNA-methyltransferase (adenine-specific) n=1 Tax=Caenorhabditis tropicalis TaxID=1561998 RepID=A0A1I7V3E1_9PELO